VPWADELARLFFIWGALLGAASACHSKVHFSVSFFTSYLRQGVRNQLNQVVKLLMVGIMAVVIFALYESLPIAAMHMLPGLEISKVWFQIPLAISCVLAAIFIGEQLTEGFSPKMKV
jgi:TRAP-type C4-dicarboxylate transport system permease small subunit